MIRRRRIELAATFGGIAVLLTAGFMFPSGVQKSAVPDHGGFSGCRDCHLEKHEMWMESNHPKAVRKVTRMNPASKECGGCHGVANPEGLEGKNAPGGGYHQVSCLACHARQETEYAHRLVRDPAKLCETCHTQRSVFWGVGARGIEDSRNFHSGVPCVSCHMTEGNHRMKVLRPDDPGLGEKRLDTCTACHKDNNREARVHQIQEWQGTYEENMRPLLEDVEKIEAAISKNPSLLDASLRSKFEDVKFNLQLLEKDGSRGFHNFVFSLEITGMAAGDLKKIKAALP